METHPAIYSGEAVRLSISFAAHCIASEFSFLVIALAVSAIDRGLSHTGDVRGLARE
jgi:hypothetical protein